MGSLDPGLAQLLQLCGNDFEGLAALLASCQQQQQQQQPAPDFPDLSLALGGSGGMIDQGGSMYDPAFKGLLLQEAAAQLAITMEQQMKQQQLAAALQLRALQQQQELTALQQHLSLGSPAYHRAFSSDLEYRSAIPLHHMHQHAAYQRAVSHDLEGLGSPQPHQRLQGMSTHPGQPGHMGHAPHLNAAPQRSCSSEQLEPRRHPALQRGTPLHLSNPPASRAPPQSRPSFNSRNAAGAPNMGQGQNRSQGNRTHVGTSRHVGGAAAKAPSWAGSDWHPLKAVLSSAANAAAPSGTGVFLPHLADDLREPKAVTHSSVSAKAQRVNASRSSSDEVRMPSADISNAVGSPACSVDGVSVSSTADPWSRTSTRDMDEGGSVFRSAPGGTAAALPAITPAHTLSPVAERSDTGRSDPFSGVPKGDCGDDEFGSLARELAELMSRQVVCD